MINVIWIDDHCMDGEENLTQLGISMCDQAYEMGIDLAPFADYKPALKALTENPSKWNAVILDIQNENKRIGNITDDFHLMKTKIVEIQHQNNSQEPYVFVFSGIDQYKNSELIPKESYATRSVYAKPNESGLMFEDIVKIVSVSPLWKIKNEHKEVFEAVEQMGWDGNQYGELFKIIYSIENDKNNTDQSLLTEMRKLLEGPIFGKFQSMGLFPSDCSTLNKRSRFFTQKENLGLSPVYVQRAIHSLAEILNNASHFSDGSEATTHLRTAKDVGAGKAPYVLRSCLYDLLTVILWAKDFHI